MRITLFGLLLAAVLLAADVTGKWSGSFDIKNPDGTTQPGPAHLELRQNGEDVTGTAGPRPDRQSAIQKGKLAGKKLTFEVESGADEVMQFDLTFDNDCIDGDVRREDGGQATGRARLSVTRVP